MAQIASFRPSRIVTVLSAVAILLVLYTIWTFLPGNGKVPHETLLTPEERSWLDSNPDKLTLYYNTDFPPIEFAAADGSFTGLGADVTAEVERRLGIEFIRIPCDDWNRHLLALEEGECAVAPTIVRTDHREEYAHFTVPYASVPVAIIATESFPDDLTLDELEGFDVAVVSGFATEDYVRQAAGGRLNVIAMWNIPEALRAVAFGEVDVFVENLAVAAYFTEQEGLSNLRVAGVTDHYFDWSIGVSRKYPLIFSSIQKALADISRSELQEMYGSWISMRFQRGVDPALMQKLRAVALFAVLLLISLSLITFYLKHKLKEKISSLKATQDELLEQSVRLKHAEKMEALGNLAGGIAHDFNNILQIIGGYTQLLLKKINIPDDEKKSLELIAGAGRRAATLISQLMAFSRHVEFRKEPVDINAEVRNAVEVLSQTIPRMIEIKTCLHQNPLRVLADPVHIEQVVFNLAGNAVDAMPHGGELIISTSMMTLRNSFCVETAIELNGEYAALTVMDTGCGIPLDVQENMYNPYYTTKEPGKGTGLGLASVYGVVKSLEGGIRCSSSEQNGTTFHILLPAVKTPLSETGNRNTNKPPVGTGETILVVDDEPGITEQTREYLTCLGYQVITASSGEEALKIRETTRTDLILLDLNMPGMGGYSCLQELKARNRDEKVLIASGHSEFDSNLRNLMEEAMGFLRKPYRLNVLAQRIREILDNRD